MTIVRRWPVADVVCSAHVVDFFKAIEIGLANHTVLNPISSDKLDEMLALLRLPDGPHVIDIACGKGELLARLASRYRASGVGVDLSSGFLNAARERLKAVGAADRIELLQEDGGGFTAPVESFDLASCVGASWIFGGHAGTLAALARWTRPGGAILVGEPFWITDPPPEYLEATGYPRDAWGLHRTNASAGEPLGLWLRHTIVSSPDDWDRYEGYQWDATLAWAEANADDPDRSELLDRSAKYQDLYLRWGRDHVGWALYLFAKLSG